MKKLFRFTSLRKKILTGFFCVLLLIVGISTYNLYTIKKINHHTETIMDEELELLVLDEKVVQDLSERMSLVRGYMLYDDEELKQEFDERATASRELDEKVQKLSDSEKINGLMEEKQQWSEHLIDAFEAYNLGNKEEAMKILRSEVKPLEQSIMDGFKELASKREKLIDEMGEDIKSNGEASLWMDAILTAAAVLLAIVISLRTARVIQKPIRTVVNRMKAVAGGNLSHEPLTTKAKDEIGELVTATNEMSTNMRDILYGIHHVSETVSGQSKELTTFTNEMKAGTEQIATTMSELSSGTESQADSASALSSHMHTYSIKVEEANQQGQQVQRHSSDVLDMTKQGTELIRGSTSQMDKIDQIVRAAVQRMESLDQQTQEISKLVAVIKDVADQTNLLALNAAIEAARAGEQGKGFAVVADEVRKLAEQVASSVTDITENVAFIQSESGEVSADLREGYREVEEGTTQMKTTEGTFEDIRTSVQEMVQNIKGSSDSLADVAAKTQEMNGHIEEIASTSQEGAASVEQTAASAQETSSSMEEVASSADHLATLAEELNQMVEKFTL